ncbi:putative Heat-shock protein [Quillaja saponaria]|uniref:Heat-shock protein n=1 Tax=Quillaja saponaria TaxID=32244 RepID=A0AAD7KS57_QUISA|nr:putative Heat-shock protein [Quillaja saponaria]
MSSSISIALRRSTGSSPTLLHRLINNPVVAVVRSTSVAPSVSRSFSTNTQVQTTMTATEPLTLIADSNRSISRRSDTIPGFFSDVFDPFFPPRSLSQMLNLMDQFTDRGIGAGSRRGWDVKEDNDALFLRMDMPGLDKDDVKVSIEQNTLVVRGEGEQESEDMEGGRRFYSRLDLPPNLYKLDSIKAEMKNGVLKLLVPKVKEEKRKDVFQVNIE